MTATFDPAISSAEDAESLAELGYTQELHRGIGGYAAFASGFSFVSILTTVFAVRPRFRPRRPRVLLHLADRVRVSVLCMPGVRRAVGEVSGRRRDLPVVPAAGRQSGP